MDTTITVEQRTVYGGNVFDPLSPFAQLLADIAKTKTLSYAALAKLKAAGFEVTVVADTEKF